MLFFHYLSQKLVFLCPMILWESYWFNSITQKLTSFFKSSSDSCFVYHNFNPFAFNPLMFRSYNNVTYENTFHFSLSVINHNVKHSLEIIKKYTTKTACLIARFKWSDVKKLLLKGLRHSKLWMKVVGIILF